MCTIKTHVVLLRVLILGRLTNGPVTQKNGRHRQIISRRVPARRGSHLTRKHKISSSSHLTIIIIQHNLLPDV
ncbi:hypothetical protein EMIT0357P_40167 [Pseudomonas marginalis]